MRHLAWLRATPGESKASRLKVRKEKGLSFDLPKIDGLERIIQYLEDLGYAERGVSGLETISWQEIKSWTRMTQLDIKPWVLKMLRRLSSEYAYQASISTEMNCPAPYEMEVSSSDMDIIRKQADEKLRRMFANG